METDDIPNEYLIEAWQRGAQEIWVLQLPARHLRTEPDVEHAASDLPGKRGHVDSGALCIVGESPWRALDYAWSPFRPHGGRIKRVSHIELADGTRAVGIRCRWQRTFYVTPDMIISLVFRWGHGHPVDPAMPPRGGIIRWEPTWTKM